MNRTMIKEYAGLLLSIGMITVGVVLMLNAESIRTAIGPSPVLDPMVWGFALCAVAYVLPLVVPMDWRKPLKGPSDE